VLRRLDAVLEPTKQTVLNMKASLDAAGITNQDAALRQAAGQAFYNTSPFRLRDLKSRTSQQKLRADFEAFLDGFSRATRRWDSLTTLTWVVPQTLMRRA
jgi:type I restriction enzyme M protein